MTLREWLERGEAQLLAGPHPDRARRDAETLLLHLIGKNRAWLLAHLADDFAGCTAIRLCRVFLSAVAKASQSNTSRANANSTDCPSASRSDVLVPRPETEHLVEKVIELAPLFRKPRIVDVGTGSGAIAIALAHEWPSAAVTAIDISEPALTVARDNAVRVGFADRIRFLQGDLLSPVIGEQFEFVVSNPPYVSIADRASLAVEVRDHEPEVALFAGEDGLDIYRRLIPAAIAALVPGGYVALEIGHGQQSDIHRLLTAAGFKDIEFTSDLQGIPRVAVAQRS